MAFACPTCGAPLRRPTLTARAAHWWTRFDGAVGSPPRSVRVEAVDGPLTIVYGLALVALGVRCALGATSWSAVAVLVIGTGGSLWGLGRRGGLTWPLRMVLVVLGEPPPAFSSRFVNRPPNRAPHVVSLHGDHPHLDDGDPLRLLSVPVGGTRRAVWVRHRTSGRIWFASWLGWAVLFTGLGVAALTCS